MIQTGILVRNAGDQQEQMPSGRILEKHARLYKLFDVFGPRDIDREELEGFASATALYD